MATSRVLLETKVDLLCTMFCRQKNLGSYDMAGVSIKELSKRMGE
jgi:hypothetical protein